MEGLSKQVLALGFPSARIILYALAKHYNKEYVSPKIEEICHIQDVGCINVEYNDENDERVNVMIVFKECKSDHNLTEQINKLKPHLETDQWEKVLKTLSSALLLVRSIYSSIYENNLDLIEEIVGYNNIDIYKTLQVDITNTTLYLPGISDRIGLFFEVL